MNDRTESDPGVFVGDVGVVSSRVLVTGCSRLVGLGTSETVEEAETMTAATQVVQEAKAL
jgi:hypothetical protein